MGFIGCSAVKQPSWLSEFSEFSVAGGWLAGSGGSARSLISITSHCCRRHHCLLCHPSTVLSSPLPLHCLLYRVRRHNSTLLIAIHTFSLCLSTYFPVLFFLLLLFYKLTCVYRAVADSAGIVMNSILLHIRRKCTLHCGFTNCLHCPKNDSLYTAENGSQPGSRTDWQHSANRQTSLQSLQTNSTGKTGRETDSLWQIHPAKNRSRQLANIEGTCN